MSAAPRVHQVLATLGYGDAIGHEVLGIQRVLRGAGYASEIFVETADPRLEHLTIDYRDMVGAIAPADILIHHFSIGSRASRTAYALPGRMVIVYHNITPPEYFIGIHKDLVTLCFRGRRELTAYIDRSDLALGDSEYNRRELDALGFPPTGVLPVVPDFTHLSGTPDTMLVARFRRRVDEHPVCRPRDSRTRSSRTSSGPFTPTARAATRVRGCCSPARTAASSATSRCSRRSSRGSARRTCTSSGTCRTRN